MTTYIKNTEDRKTISKRIAEITGQKLKYTMPACTFVGQGFTVTREGNLEADETADSAVLDALIAEGLILAPAEPEAPAPAEEPTAAAGEPEAAEGAEEPTAGEGTDTGRQDAPQGEETGAVSLTVSVPADRHTGETLRNLVNLLFTRGSLLNKALGTGFRVDEGLTEALQNDGAVLSAEAFRKAVAAYEDEHGRAIDGLTIEPDKVTFSSLPETAEPEKLRTFTVLCGMMNKSALEQKRILAKAVNEENEKYALRIWLTRLGMNGPEYKEERKVLMANLTGHCAFRTPAEEEKWKKRQAEKRDALKAAKAAAQQSEEVDSDEISA